MLQEEWHIPKERCHMILRDNAPNMVKAAELAGLPSRGCFAHTLQLALNHGLFGQPSVNKALHICRKMVGHFKHSSTATAKLQAIQQEIGLPIHQLVQDVPTRWNSTHDMVSRLVEQKRAVTLYFMEGGTLGAPMAKKVKTPSQDQWVILEGLLHLLKPLKDLTAEVSSSDASLSLVLPASKMIIHCLRNTPSENLQTIKADLIKELEKRFTIDDDISLSSTYLDLRFTSCLSGVQRERAIAFLRAATSTSDIIVLPAATSVVSISPSLPPAKRARTTGTSDLWDCWMETIDSSSTPAIPVAASDAELHSYDLEPRLDRQDNPLAWWGRNRTRFPILANMARSFLACPATSVQSERVFSLAGNVISDTRCRLLPENAERLLFLKYNAEYMN
jgi:hypothetical protein